MRRTKLGHAKLVGAQLSGVNLLGADLRDADLRGASFDEFTTFPHELDPIAAGAIYLGIGGDLRGVDLRPYAQRLHKLDDTNLQDANLEGLDMKGLSLKRADLRGATAKGARWGIDDGANCATLEDTIMPDGERFTGLACGKDFPARYKGH